MMLSALLSGLWQDRHPLLRVVVLLLPLMFFVNGRGEAHFALPSLQTPIWLSIIQLVLGLTLLFFSQLTVAWSRQRRWSALLLSGLRVLLKCGAAYLIGYLTVSL